MFGHPDMPRIAVPGAIWCALAEKHGERGEDAGGTAPVFYERTSRRPLTNGHRRHGRVFTTCDPDA